LTPQSSLTSPIVKYRLAGMGGNSLCGMTIIQILFFDGALELLAGMEGNHAPRGNRNFLSGFWIPARALWLVAQLKIAEAGQLDVISGFQRFADLFEKSLNHIPGFPLVQTHSVEERINQLGFC
jgi:ABC-type antimicrobial peptide transport system permease subunit